MLMTVITMYLLLFGRVTWWLLPSLGSWAGKRGCVTYLGLVLVLRRNGSLKNRSYT